jgi:hypothetical protein
LTCAPTSGGGAPWPVSPELCVPDLASRIAAGEDLAMSERLRKAEMIGRPVGSSDFIANLER